MRSPATVPAGTPARRLSTPVLSAREVASTYLAPADPFPTTLAELELVELHVLHSRITRQLEREYTDPAGPHPVTRDRTQELVAELDTRQDFLASFQAAPLAEPGTDAPQVTRSAAARPRSASHHWTLPAQKPTVVPPQSTPAAPSRDEQPSSTLTPRSGQGASEAGIPIHDLTRLRPGERIQAWRQGQLLYVGTVEEVAPDLGVVWIREVVDGYRRLVHAQDTELRYPRPCGGGGDHG